MRPYVWRLETSRFVADEVQTHMDLEEFKYELPDSLIATYPSRDRQDSRLLVVKRSTGEVIHSVFSELGNFLDLGDLLVLNDAKVFPARLRGTKESGGKVEVLLLEQFPAKRSLWIALVDAAKRPAVGSQIRFNAAVTARVMGDLGRGRFGLEFHHPGDFDEQLQNWTGSDIRPSTLLIRAPSRRPLRVFILRRSCSKY